MRETIDMEASMPIEADLEILIMQCGLARAGIDARLAVLATEVREQIVVPICQRYRLEYHSSPQDSWYFIPLDGAYYIGVPKDFDRYTLEELPQAARDALVLVLALLGGELGGYRGATLADLIEDVNASILNDEEPPR